MMSERFHFLPSLGSKMTVCYLEVRNVICSSATAKSRDVLTIQFMPLITTPSTNASTVPYDV